jgi:hypothetical protein
VSHTHEDDVADIARLGDIMRELFVMGHRAAHLRGDRARIVDRLHSGGMSHADIATLTGVTRQRVHQWAQHD